MDKSLVARFLWTTVYKSMFYLTCSKILVEKDPWVEDQPLNKSERCM